MDTTNKLYFGDNLKILREYVPDGSVDLIYLDPPFNSSATYNVLFKEKSGEESAAQITAFEDTWQWSQEAEAVYREIVREVGRIPPRGALPQHTESAWPEANQS
jgi:site-specific DNA-methyltransferase (adenine-specific)